MKKKILLSLLALSLLPINNIKAESNVFYSESYENFTTNDLPGEYEFYAENVHVVQRKEKQEKSVEMTSSDGELVIERSFETAGNDISVRFDMAMLSNSADGEIALNIGGGKYISILNILDSYIYSHDGKKLFELTKDYKTITVHIDKTNKRYDVYLNGKSVLSRWFCKNLGENVGGFKITMISSDDNEFELGFDNLYAYEGNVDAKDLIKPEYNDDYIEFIPSKSENELTVPIVNTAFEQGYGIGGVLINQSDNTVEVTKEDNGNGILRFALNSANGCYIDIPKDEYPKNLVLEFDVRTSDSGVGGGVIARGEKATFNWLVNINENRTITVGGGTVLGKVKTGDWTKVQLILNFRKHIITAYCNGKLISDNIAMSTVTDDVVQRLRIGAFSGTGSIEFDNLLVYQGKYLKTFEEKDPNERTLVFEDNSGAQKLIGDNIALHVGSGTIYSGNEKRFLDVPAFIENNYTYVPVRAICEALGLDVSWIESENKVKVGNGFEFVVGDSNVICGDKTVTIENSARNVNGRVFLPLRDLCETLLGKKVFWNDRGLIIISDATVKLTETQLLAVHDYMAYDRPTAKDFDELYRKNNMQNVHPRIMAVQSDFDRIKQYIENGNPTVSELFEKLKKSGDQLLLQALPERTDNVQATLGIAKTAVTMAQTLGMLYKITGEEKYAEKLWEYFDVICNSFEDWYHVETYLTTSEMTAGAAVAYDWLYDYWNDEQKKSFEKAIREKSLYYADKTYYAQTGAWQDWTVLANNWNFVCSGGAVMGASAIYDTDPEFCSDIIVNSVRSVEKVIKHYYPDGAWMEGTNYWQYATTYCVNLMATLEKMVNTDFNLSKAPGFSKTGIYSVATQGPNGTLGEHDGGAEKMTPYPNMYLAGKFDDAGLGAFKLHSIRKNNVIPPAVDLIWYKESFDNPLSTLANDAYYDGTSPKIVMREKWNDDEAAFLGYHIDKGSVDHGHIDSGNFVFDMQGVRFATDLGPDDYTNPGYFTTDRSKFYRVRPEGHNVLVINPDDGVGQQSSKEIAIVKNVFKNNGSYSVADLTDTYSDDVNDYKRGYMLYNDRRNIIIRDEVNLKSESELYWFMHTGAAIEIINDNTAILKQNNKSIRLDFTTNADEFEMSVMNAEALPTSPSQEKQKSTAGIQKIAIKFKASGRVYMNVRFTSCDDPLYDEEIYDESIENWEIEEKPIVQIPKLSGIYLDGAALEGFMSDTSSYTVDVLKGGRLPEISATAESDAKIEIVQAENVREKSVITISLKDDPRYRKVYTISYNSVVNADGFTRYVPEGIFSSYEAQDGYIAQNVIDMRADTWWAAYGNGEYITIDYGSVKDIDVIGIDMLYGLRRKTYFTLEVSQDGENWTKIFDGANSQKTDDMEYIDTEGTKARYLKLVNYGNSENSQWISLAEVEAYGK